MSKIYRMLSDGQTQIVDSPDELSMALKETAKSLRDLKLNNAQSSLARAQAGYSDAMAEQARQNAIWLNEVASRADIEDKKASLKARLWGEEKYKNLNEREIDSVVEKMWNTMNMFSGVAQ